MSADAIQDSYNDHYVSQGWLRRFADDNRMLADIDGSGAVLTFGSEKKTKAIASEADFWTVDARLLNRVYSNHCFRDVISFFAQTVKEELFHGLTPKDISNVDWKGVDRLLENKRCHDYEDRDLKNLNVALKRVNACPNGTLLDDDVRKRIATLLVHEYVWGLPARRNVQVNGPSTLPLLRNFLSQKEYDQFCHDYAALRQFRDYVCSTTLNKSAIDALLSYRWTIIRNRTVIPFLVSDRPFMLSDYLIDKTCAEYKRFIPITRKIGVFLKEPCEAPGYHGPRVFETKDSVLIKQLNWYAVATSLEHTYGADAAELSKIYISLMRGELTPLEPFETRMKMTILRMFDLDK